MSLFAELKRRNVIRVGIAYVLIAWVSLQTIDFVLDVIQAPDWVIQALVAVAGVGLVGFCVFAWVFELTPEGLKREAEVDNGQSITPRTGRRLDRVIIVFLAVAVAFLLADRYYLDEDESDYPGPETPGSESQSPGPAEGETPQSPSIAVLPFVNMSADAENEYFSDGISEELLNVLVRVSALEVASRTSSFAYRGKDLPLSQIAAELGVNHILEGSVRKAGNRVRITAQLIDASSDRHLWSDTFERELDDIFDIQEEISNSIVNALKVALDLDEKAAMERVQRPTDNPHAYELYLQGRQQWQLREEASLHYAIDSFRQATALDPDFARAHEALAAAWVVLPAWSDFSVEDSKRLAMESANRALALDSRLGEALAIRAHVRQLDLAWVAAMREFAEARRLEPRNATVAQWYAEFLGDVGYTSRALAEARQAYRLDPASRVINLIVAAFAGSAGEHELAIEHMNRAIKLGVDPSRAAWVAVDSLLILGQHDTVRELLVESDDAIPLLRACVHSLLADDDGMDVSDMLAAHPDAPKRIKRWCAFRAGKPEGASEVLLEALRENSTNIRLVWGPSGVASEVRRMRGFRQALEDSGLIELYRAEGWPDQCEPLGEREFVCE